MNNYFLEILGRMTAFKKREQEKRDAEDEAFNRAMAENAEYIEGLREKFDAAGEG